MAFKHAAGAGIIPTLSRLVLAAAFITVGYNKIFKEATFDAVAATTLTSLGVDVTPVGAEPPVANPGEADADTDPAEAGAPDDAGSFIEPPAGAFRLASIVTPPIQVPPPVENAAEEAAEVLRQANENAQAAGEELAEGAQDAVGGAIDQAGDVAGDIVDGAQDAVGEITDGVAAAGDAFQDAAGDAIDAVGDAAADGAEAITGDAPAAEPLPDGAYTARALHRITLLSEANKLPMPAIMAWVAAITEFIGGIALLVGLLTRFWSMGLVIAMGTAFYMVSMNKYGVHTTNPFVYAEFANVENYNSTVAQLSLGILALGLVLTGAGPISLDRLVFPPDKVKEANANAAAAAGMGGGALVNAAAQGPSGQVISQPHGGPHDVPGVAIPPGVQTPYAQPAYAQPDPYAQPAAGGGLQAQPTPPAGYGQPNPAPAPSDVPLQGSGDAAPPADQMPPTDDLGGGEPPRPRPETSFGGEGRPL